MFFKDNLCLAFLLLLIVILFSVFSEYRHNLFQYNKKKIEGMDNQTTGTPDDPVPSCGGATDVPGCYNTIIDDRSIYGYNGDNHNSDSDYILKTQIVPPVCPACPSLYPNYADVSGSESNDNFQQHEDENKREDNLEKKNTTLNKTTINETTINKMNTSEVNNRSTNNSLTNNRSTNNSSTNNPSTNNPSTSGNFGLFGENNKKNTQDNSGNNKQDNNNNNNNPGLLGNSILTGGQQSSQDYESQIESLRNELNSLKQQNAISQQESCPPCPPCDRCPEPIFSCEKTINYRSPNIGQYMPLPVLNDFSSFGNSQ